MSKTRMTEADVTRLLNGSRKAGFDVRAIEFKPDGSIIVTFKDAKDARLDADPMGDPESLRLVV
jgi:hypothetical protein